MAFLCECLPAARQPEAPRHVNVHFFVDEVGHFAPVVEAHTSRSSISPPQSLTFEMQFR